MPPAFTVMDSPVTSVGTLAVTAAGDMFEYIRGDGLLATLPVYTASNGLTLTAHNSKLGGTLIEFTDINNDGNEFFLHGTAGNTLRTNNGIFQANVVSSQVSASLSTANSSTNLFSEVNAADGTSTMHAGNSTTFYNTIAVTTTYVRLQVSTNTVAPLRFQLSLNGQLSANAYGIGSFPGTAAYTLQVDALGNIIEGSLSPASAQNGLSVSTTNAVLGQDVGQLGNPGALLSNREIPTGAFTLKMLDTSGNSNTFGAGTNVSARLTGTNFTSTNTTTTNVNAFNTFATTTITYGTFTNYTAFGIPIFATKRFNTLTAGVTLTTTVSNRQGVYSGTLGFENDIAANNNTITIAGGIPVSVYNAKIDFWPGAGAQTKTIVGAIAAYSSYLDLRSGINCVVDTYIDFDAGRGDGNIGQTNTVTSRIGLRIADLATHLITSTNRWAIYQEGTTDSNYFGGNIGIGQTTPTARLHVAAGTATANSAPIKLTSGTNLTTPEDGAFEFDGTNLYFTVGGVRKTVQLV
jgi:hypothetical protein